MVSGYAFKMEIDGSFSEIKREIIRALYLVDAGVEYDINFTLVKKE